MAELMRRVITMEYYTATRYKKIELHHLICRSIVMWYQWASKLQNDRYMCTYTCVCISIYIFVCNKMSVVRDTKDECEKCEKERDTKLKKCIGK